MKSAYPLCLALALTPSLVLAQDSTDPVETLVVTATRSPQSADQVIAPVVVIDRATIERSVATDLADLLKFHAGLDVARNGGPGQPTSVFLRGTESNHTLVMIDGVKINPGTAGGAALQHLSPDLVERIEIVKGPRSALYGSEAIGGVINVITRNGHGGNHLSASLGGGRFGTRDSSVQAVMDGTAGSLGAGVSWLSTDGFPVQAGTEMDRGHDNRSLNLHGDIEWQGLTVSARHWETRGNTEYLDFFLAPLDQDFTNRSSALEVQSAPTEAWRSQLTLARATDEVSQNQSPDFFVTERETLDWQNDLDLGAHQLTAGLSLSREDTMAMSWGSGYDESTRISALYLQDRYSRGAHELVAALRQTDHETAGAHGTWNVDYGYRLSPALRLTAGAGTGFRAPNSSERFGFGGNPALEPETSTNLELGIDYRLDEAQQLWLRAFDNDIDNLVEYVILDFNTWEGVNRNVASTRIRGFEAGYAYRGERWQGRVEAISQDPVDRETGEQLLRRARNTVTASLVRTFGAHELGVDILSTDERKDFGFPEPVTLPGYTLANLSGRVALGEHWWLQGKVENLLDRQYQTVAGYTTSGRGIYFSLNYRSR